MCFRSGLLPSGRPPITELMDRIRHVYILDGQLHMLAANYEILAVLESVG